MSDVSTATKPAGDAAIRILAMPANTNPNGDIFGGWLMSLMDIAGGTVALERAGGRVATVAVDAMTFHKPVFVGDVVSCYARILGIGRTSIRVHVEAWARRSRGSVEDMVTQGCFTYVAIDDSRRPRPIEAGPATSA